MGLVAGSIDYEEFLAATVNLNHLEKEDTMYNAFKHFDKDNSGYISQQELEDALTVRLRRIFNAQCFCHLRHFLARTPPQDIDVSSLTHEVLGAWPLHQPERRRLSLRMYVMLLLHQGL